MRKLILVFSLFFLLWTTDYGLSTSYASIPRIMNYQGKATDRAGTPLHGTYNLTFRIYNAATGGTAKWWETHTDADVTNGVFQVQLGSVNPLNLAFDEAYWVSLEINTDGEMTPRTRLASVGYAYTAEYANNAIPAGVVMAWTTDTPPDGWLLCDGRAVSRATYGRLFNIIGSTYGAGDGSTTFNLPNMQGRVPAGKSSEAEFNTLGKTGGEKTHTLSIAEMPAHTHARGYSVPHVDSGFQSATGTGTQPSLHTGSAGGGSAHNNLQPYITLNYIIKT